MTYCFQCKKEIQLQDSYCRYCGCHQNVTSNEADTDNNNQNIITGNKNISNNNVVGENHGSITNNNNFTNNNVENCDNLIPKLNLVDTKKTSIKSIWVMAMGGIGFLSSILTIIGYFRQYGLLNSFKPIPLLFTLIIPIVIAFSLYCFYSGLELMKGNKKIIGGKVFQTDAKGYIKYSKIYADCPVSFCSGNLTLSYCGKEDSPIVKLICNNYPNRHKFEFYTSELPDSNS